MTTIEINKKYHTLPTAWNELSGRQLVYCMVLFSRTMSDARLQLELIRLLSGISPWQFFRAQVSELSEYFYLLDFLFKENTLTKNLLPNHKDFFGPADDLSNLIVSEYIFAESHYQQYKEQKSIADLNNLCAVLYRPAKANYDIETNPDGDVREAFNENLIGYYGSKISHWPTEVKLAILHFYEGCRIKLEADNPDVFGGGGDPLKRGILSVAINVADAGTFGDFSKVERLYLQTFLIGISESMDKVKKMEGQLKKQPA